MSDILNSFIMGVVEGITEFLPVSSTGHLIITKELLQFQGSDTFEVVIQLGGVLAVIWFYFSKIWNQVKSVKDSAEVRKFWLTVICAFLPAAFVGLATHKYITEYLFNPITVASSLIVGGIVMWLVEGANFKPKTVELEQMSIRQGFLIGCAQLFSLIPGVSRSASTIMGGMLFGLDRSTATSFSFFLSIPTLGAASIYSLLQDLQGVSDHGVTNIAVGLITSFVVSLLSIGWLLRYISKHNFRGFAIYRIIAGVIVLALALTGFFTTAA